MKKYTPKWISYLLINTFGRRVIKFLNSLLLFFVLQIISFPLAFFLASEKLISSGAVLLILAFPFILCFLTEHVLEYHEDSLCRLCGRKFACKEIKGPLMKEISSPDKYTVTIIRYWECKYCKLLDIREGPEHINAMKVFWGPAESLKWMRCKKCGTKGNIEEFKRTDIREDIDSWTWSTYKRTKKSYYKCKNCGYTDVDVKCETISDDIY